MRPPSDADGLTKVTPDEQRAVLLELVTQLDRWCKDRGLTYFLYAGTLLGAVRHQGFIPWDDDVDVMMPRADYEVLCRDFTGAGSVRLVDSRTVPTYPYAYAKVTRVDTLLMEHVIMAPGDRFGINVDVFPIDHVSSRTWVFHLHARLSALARAVLLAKVVDPGSRRAVTRVALSVSQIMLRPVPTRTLVKLRDRVARMKRRDSGYGAVLVVDAPQRIPHATLVPPRPIVFEGHLLAAPADPHALLTAKYGDYQTPPPAAQRVPPHDSVAFWRRQNRR